MFAFISIFWLYWPICFEPYLFIPRLALRKQFPRNKWVFAESGGHSLLNLLTMLLKCTSKTLCSFWAKPPSKMISNTTDGLKKNHNKPFEFKRITFFCKIWKICNVCHLSRLSREIVLGAKINTKMLVSNEIYII